MDEFALINHYFKRDNSSLKTHENIALGIGDDCALIDIPVDHHLAFSIDTLLPDVHFFANDDPALIASRALCVSLSDLAAMGAKPLCFTLAIALPSADEAWLQGFSDGLLRTATRYQCPLVGGDTVRGPLTISIQVQGTVPKGQALQRSTACVGDAIVVSGPLGDGAAALAFLKGELTLDDSHHEYLRGRYYHPEPCFQIGGELVGLANAAIDISDGLIADLGHICTESGVGAVIDLASIPVAKFIKENVARDTSLPWALYGGDDYQLCFTVKQENLALLPEMAAAHDLDFTVIGTVTKELGIRCQATGQELSKTRDGYKHF